MTDGSVWDPKSILGIDPEEISTNHLTDGYGVTHWSVKASIQGSGNAAVWNFARPANLGAFISSLYKKDYELLKRSIKDVIIEPYRSELIPEFKNLKKIALKNNALGFGISGSGPSMFSLCKGIKSANSVIENMEYQLDKMDINYKSYISKINKKGLKIL